MKLIVILSIATACLYELYFLPCENNTQAAFVLPLNCSNNTQIYLKKTPCNLICNPGQFITYRPGTNSIICQDCPAGTFSNGGGETISSWDLVKDNLITYCWVLEENGWELGKECTPWSSSEDEFLVSGRSVKNKWYKTSIIFFKYFVKPGKFFLTYRKETEFHALQDSGQLSIYIDNNVYFIDFSTNSSKWLDISFDLPEGLHEVEITFSTLITDYMNQVQIKEIQFRGTEYSTKQCEFCLTGHSPAGSDTCILCQIGTYLNTNNGLACLPCPDGTSSLEGSVGIESCKSQPPCTDSDFHFTFSPCFEGKKTKIFQWNFPLLCSNLNLKLPDSEKEECGDCPAGMFFSKFKCEYCPSGLFKGTYNSECLICGKGMYAPKVKVYEEWSEVPEDFLISCVTSSNTHCRYSWEARGTYLVSSPYYNTSWSVYLEKTLNIDHEGSYLYVEYEIIGNETIFSLEINTQVFYFLQGSEKGNKTFFFSKGKNRMFLICRHGSRLNESCAIKKIVIFGSDQGGAQDCLTCPNGFVSNGKQTICTSCPAGKTSNKLGDKCESCTGLMFSDVSGPCVLCPPNTEPNLDHSFCVFSDNITISNRTFIVDKLVGKVQPDYCNEKRMEMSCFKTFFGPVQWNSSFFYISTGNPSVPEIPSFSSFSAVPAYSFGIIDKNLFHSSHPAKPETCDFDNTKVIVSLGSRIGPMSVTENGFSVRYINGSHCGNYSFSAYVEYVCSKKDIEGWPVGVSLDKCQFNFVWPTVHACRLCEEKELVVRRSRCLSNLRTVHVMAGKDCFAEEARFEEKCESEGYYTKVMKVITFVILIFNVAILVVMCGMTVRLRYRKPLIEVEMDSYEAMKIHGNIYGLPTDGK